MEFEIQLVCVYFYSNYQMLLWGRVKKLNSLFIFMQNTIEAKSMKSEEVVFCFLRNGARL